MSQTATELRVVLANTFAFYFRAHVFHWNVTGILFHSLHQYFGSLYESLFAAIDPTAEQIRALDELAPASLTELLAPSTIEHSDATPGTVHEMISELLGHNALVLESLYKAHTAAEAENHDGVVNFIEGRIDAHAKIAWQLKSHLIA